MSNSTPQIGDVIIGNSGVRYVVYNVGATKMSIMSEHGIRHADKSDSHYHHGWIRSVHRGGQTLEIPEYNDIAEFGQIWESEHDEDCVIVYVWSDDVTVCHRDSEGQTWRYGKKHLYNNWNLKGQA